MSDEPMSEVTITAGFGRSVMLDPNDVADRRRIVWIEAYQPRFSGSFILGDPASGGLFYVDVGTDRYARPDLRAAIDDAINANNLTSTNSKKEEPHNVRP